MSKTLLLTGATDGIGFETARMLVSMGHRVLLHGRSRGKLEQAEARLSEISGGGPIEAYLADLSRMTDVDALTDAVASRHSRLDALINNAGVYRVPEATTPDGLDVRFVVNTLAPYRLTQRLLPRLDASSRVVNLSSAAQAPVDPAALEGRVRLSDSEAYAQSKLALTMWSRQLARTLGDQGPVVVAVNPGSMLGSKMVKEAYGVAGGDLRVGAEILCRAALDDAFADASGQYFDNDSRRFASPHPDALDDAKSERIVRLIAQLAERAS